jgi:hypothetical protein
VNASSAYICGYLNARGTIALAHQPHRLVLSLYSRAQPLLVALEDKYGGYVTPGRWVLGDQRKLLTLLRNLRRGDGIAPALYEWRDPELEAAIRFLEIRKDWHPRRAIESQPPQRLLDAEQAFLKARDAVRDHG